MIDLEGLEKLRAEGTAGPWRTVGDKSPNMTGVHAGPHTSGDSYLLFTLVNDPNDDGPMGEGGLLPETVAQWKADAALIVAAVNALPELIAMARRVETEAACYASTSAAANNVIDGLKAENERLRGAFYVNENGVERMLRFLAEAGHRVDPIVMSSAVGLYLETIARTALKEKPQ